MQDPGFSKMWQKTEAADSSVVPRRTRVAKRVLDIVVAVPAMVLALPIGIVLGIAIRLNSPGPVFFRQERVGHGGEVFRILKFRTMHHNSDEGVHQHHVLELAESLSQDPLCLRLENDDRLTPVGCFLRKWSLDELPNLWNVLVGEMSVVGPRPLVPYEVERLSSEAFARFSVRPGITGLAQVNGRLDASFDGRTDHDVAYVEHVSLGSDLAIIVRTPATLFRRRGL